MTLQRRRLLRQLTAGFQFVEWKLIWHWVGGDVSGIKCMFYLCVCNFWKEILVHVLNI